MGKSKRKENPAARKTTIIAAILAIFLLMTLFFPVRFLAVWALNPLVYGLLAITCGWMVIRLARRIGWRRKAVLLFTVCILLTSVHAVQSLVRLPYGQLICTSDSNASYFLGFAPTDYYSDECFNCENQVVEEYRGIAWIGIYTGRINHWWRCLS